ncbi:hypothetical protein ACSFCW_26605 [Yokenella regensburgei]|uniref:hypothetical protein n=1 Tax=Yokenella regensburgei TaxID=158877 RepID=UPI003ED937A1
MIEQETITLRLGVFHDGTGMNALYNSNKLKSGEDAWLYSNVYRLYQKYKPSDDMLKVYIEGVGMPADNTKPTLESDIVFATGVDFDIDIHFGIIHKHLKSNNLGVFSKHKLAVIRLCNKLNEYLTKNPPSENTILNLEFDCFGFSRGAALARHFACKLFSKDAETVGEFGKIITQFNCVLDKCTTNFLGVFDTVPTVWSYDKMWMDPHDTTSTNGFEVNLPANVANGVLQLTASHECRYNLGLNSLKGFYPELELAGAHSDIGGGYAASMIEKKRVTDYFKYGLFSPHNRSKSDADDLCKKQLSDALSNDHTKWGRLINIDDLNLVEAWKDKHTIFPLSLDKYAEQGVLTRKNIDGSLQYVSYMLMLDAAMRHSCSFDSSAKSYEIYIGKDLEGYYSAARVALDDVLSGKMATIPQEYIDDITEKYIHISADWMMIGAQTNLSESQIASSETLSSLELDQDALKMSMSIEETLTFLNILYANIKPNRPDDKWKRMVWVNDQTLK